jgi:hypothetical protein
MYITMTEWRIGKRVEEDAYSLVTGYLLIIPLLLLSI